jgi:hypothetical protein
MQMIYISKDFRFKTDQYGHTLESRSDGKVKATGEDKDMWTVSYHPTHKQVAKKVLETALNKETVEESVNELNKIQDTLERLSGSLGSQITKVVES